jgi:hypothetical protein
MPLLLPHHQRLMKLKMTANIESLRAAWLKDCVFHVSVQHVDLGVTTKEEDEEEM